MGRRKIEIQPLADDRNRTVTFLKRKAGLFKKAHELAVLCQVDLAVIILGNNNRLYEFSSVDTKELISVCSKLKPHESKSPENYGNYHKRKYLHQNYVPTTNASLKRASEDMGDDIDVNESDYDYDESDSSEPSSKKRKIDAKSGKSPNMKANTIKNAEKSNNSSQHRPNLAPSNSSGFNVPQYGPAFTNPKMPPYHDLNQQANHRPVLRVQIPITSVDSNGGNINNNNHLGNKVSNGSHVADGKPDSAKTITAVDPAQTTDVKPTISMNGGMHQNADANGKVDQKNLNGAGPSLPINASKYATTNSFRSPVDSRKPALPLPVHTKSQTSSPSNPNAPQLPMAFFTSLAQASPSSLYPNQTSGMFHTPVLSQMFNSVNFHPPGQLDMPNIPGSALPSRYLHDTFPSPSNFYASQDWPSGSVLTPFHQTSAPFLTPIAPTAVGGGGSGTGSGANSSFLPPPQLQNQAPPTADGGSGGTSVNMKSSK